MCELTNGVIMPLTSERLSSGGNARWVLGEVLVEVLVTVDFRLFLFSRNPGPFGAYVASLGNCLAS